MFFCDLCFAFGGHFYSKCEVLDALKGKVHPIMKICLKCTHPQAIQDVDEFVSFSE